jgi:hypothetical protein
MNRYYISTFSDRPFNSYHFQNVRSIDEEIFTPVTCGPGPQINLIPGAGFNFFIGLQYTNARFY